MFPARHSASLFSRKTLASFAAQSSYTTRSNGAAFLNNLDFLAPAPSTRATAPSASSPRSFQPSTNAAFNNDRRPQSSNREFLQKFTKTVEDPSFLKPASSTLADLDLPLTSTPRRTSGAQGRPAHSNLGNNNSNNTNNTNNNNRPNDRSRDKRAALDRPRRDEEIESTWIQFITPEGNQGDKRLASVLRSFDRTQFFLVEVDAGANPPICKLFSKKELYEKAKAAKQAKKANDLPTKELQLNWGTDPHDLEHKLAKSRAFLEKGYRLEIQVNGKKGKSTTPLDREKVMERIKQEFEPVSKYVKNPDWIKATTVTMLLQGVAKKGDKAGKGKKE